MTWMLLPGPTVLAEVPLGLLLLVMAVPVVMLLVATMIAAATYRMGERAAPTAAQHTIGGLEGQCAAKDAVIEQQVKLIARQAEQIGSVRGARKHLRAVGV